MRGWAGAWVGLVALVAACGDGESGAPADAARQDGSSPADADGNDASAGDAAPACDEDRGLPDPPACAQTIPWAAYLGDELVEDRAEMFVLTMSGAPGESAVASGGHDVLLFGSRHTWSFSPDAGSVAFTSDDPDDQWRLYAAPMTAAGPGETREISGPFEGNGQVTWWAWSPDGRKIAYIADQEQEGVPELWVVDLASGEPAQRVNAPFDGPGGFVWDAPWMPTAWSPDSSMLLFRAGRNLTDDDELYVADVSGAAPAPPVSLTSNTDDNALRWAWSADGRSVVFYTTVSLSVAHVACGAIVDGPHVVTPQPSLGEVLSPEGDALIYLERIDAQSVALRRADLTVMPPISSPISEPLAITFDSDLAWSPALHLTFRTESDLEFVNGTTGARTVVNGPLVDGGQVFRFAWSPDGQSIAYTANQLDVSQVELFHVDLSGSAPSEPERVSLRAAHEVGVGDFWWSPDSSHLAYVANQDLETRIELHAAARVDGVMDTPIRVNRPLERDGARVFAVRWSPDGSRLLYNSNDAGAGISDGFVVDLAAPGAAMPINGGPDVFDLTWAPCPAP